MDTKDLKNLMEAYSEVYSPIDEATAMAKRGYDEAPIRQKIAKSTGGGEAADRATKLADRPTFGDAKKEKQRQNLARAQRGDFRKTTSSSPGLHGYGHKSNDPAVKAKQAARGAQRGALTPAEKKQLNREEVDIFDVVLEFLQVEGYAETLQEAEWMMANLIDEEAIAIILGESAIGTMAVLGGMAAGRAIHGKLQDRKAKKELEGKRRTSDYLGMKSRTKNVVARDRRASGDTRNEEFELWVNELVEEGYDLSNYTWDEMYEFYLDEAIYSEKGKAKAAEMIAKRSTPSGRAKPGKGANVAQIRQIRGSGRGDFDKEGLGGTPMTPTMAKNPRKKQNYTGTGNKAARRAGLTPTREKPNAWKEEYMDEAQHARENPEKYEREQAKKSAPVRGERTPMPPRGDKRREDFEKWYAKQMGR